MKIPNVIVPGDHNTGARIIEHGKHFFYYSSGICVAYRCGAQKLRIACSHVGETVRRHLDEMDCLGWDAVPKEEFDKILEEI